jgi:hypothetical protein
VAKKTFEDELEELKSEVWHESPSKEHVMKKLERLVGLAESQAQFRRLEIVLGFSKMSSYRERFYEEFGKEFETLRYITCSA